MSTSILTNRADMIIKRVSTFALVVVALAAGALSWSGLTALGDQAGIQFPILLPLVIDGAMLAGALGVLHAGLAGVSARWGWGMTIAGVIVSTWGNIVGSPEPGLVAAGVHSLPAIVLAACVEQQMRLTRHGIAAQAAAERETEMIAQRARKEQERHEAAVRAAEVRAAREAAREAALPAEERTHADLTAVRALLATVAEDASQIERVMHVLAVLPEVKTNILREALPGLSYNTVSKARARLSEREHETEEAHAEPVMLRAV